MTALTFGSSRPGPAGFAALLLLLGIWFGIVFSLALAGGFQTPAGQVPWPILVALGAPILLFLALYHGVPRFRALTLALDLRPLILLHVTRTVGLGFVFLAAHGVLPLAFAIPAGFGDAVAAIGALFVGVGLYSRAGVSKRTVAGWNAFGLLDLAVAVATGILSRTDGLLQFPGAVSSNAIGGSSLAWIPGFAVPLFVITHLIVYLQLRNHWRGQQRIRYPHQAAG